MGEAKKKLTYEELETMCSQITQQNRMLVGELQKSNYSNLAKRLEFLFEVVKQDNKFNAEFVESVTQEIVELLTIDKEPEVKDEEA